MSLRFAEISRETGIPENEIRKYYRAVNKVLPKTTSRTSAPNLVVRITILPLSTLQHFWLSEHCSLEYCIVYLAYTELFCFLVLLSSLSRAVSAQN